MSLHTLLKPFTSRYPRLLLSAKLHTCRCTCCEVCHAHWTVEYSTSVRRCRDPQVRHEADAAHLGEQLSMQPRPFKETNCIPTSQPPVRVCKIIGGCCLGGT